MKTKKCSTCKKEKPLSEFTKKKNQLDGLCGQCKECVKKYRERTKDRDKAWRIKNKERLKKKSKKYYLDNQERIKTRVKQYREENKEAKKKVDKEYLLKNRDRLLQYKKDYYTKNKKRLRKIQVERERNQRKNNPNFKLAQLLRHRLNHALNGNLKTDKTLNLLGCSIEEFKKHLQAQFKEGMTWKNHGRKGWHIDHIQQCCTFDLTNEDEQRKCFHYSNLRPLWAEENLKRPKQT